MATEPKLKRDLEIMALMATEMADYLDSDVLFWPMAASGMPKLTLGGYLMRQHRLLALADTLQLEEQQALSTAVADFNAALSERVVRFEQKAHTELDARIRQWSEFIREMQENRDVSRAGYATAVEARAMIAAILDKLRGRPYELESRIPSRIHALDAQLRTMWQPGEFVWPQEWMEAYPQQEYWWLYGLPRFR